MEWLVFVAVVAAVLLARGRRDPQVQCRACGGSGQVAPIVGRRLVTCRKCGGVGARLRRGAQQPAAPNLAPRRRGR